LRRRECELPARRGIVSVALGANFSHAIPDEAALIWSQKAFVLIEALLTTSVDLGGTQALLAGIVAG